MGIILKSKINKMPEICFEAPEINMASDIVLDARVSIVTVSKLVDVNVTGNCVCPSGSSGNFESIEKSRNVSTVFERAPARAAPRSVTSSDDAAPKVMTSFSEIELHQNHHSRLMNQRQHPKKTTTVLNSLSAQVFDQHQVLQNHLSLTCLNSQMQPLLLMNSQKKF